MNKLLVDAGNHSIKWATLTDDGLERSESISWSSDESLELRWSDIDPVPGRVVVSNVAGAQGRDTIERTASSCWSLDPDFIESTDVCCGVMNGYTNPSQLGVDRWLAMIAAKNMTAGAVIVVDCGTAVTIDLVDHEGQFRGGVIMAGLELSRDALRGGTAALASYQSERLTCIATSTADAVTSGTLIGLAGAIERVIREQSELVVIPPAIYLTGGDAEQMQSLMGIDTEIRPDLVLYGLKVWTEIM